MLYIRVKWFHAESEPPDPVELYYEIGQDGWAQRGIEVFFDGSLSKVTIGLKKAPIPPLEEIRSLSDFEGSEITKEEFEAVWARLAESESH